MKDILKFIIIVTTKNEINEIPPKILYALGIQAEFSFFYNIMIKIVPQYIQFHVTITHHFYIQKEFNYKGLFFKSCFQHFFFKTNSE